MHYLQINNPELSVFYATFLICFPDTTHRNNLTPGAKWSTKFTKFPKVSKFWIFNTFGSLNCLNFYPKPGVITEATNELIEARVSYVYISLSRDHTSNWDKQIVKVTKENSSRNALVLRLLIIWFDRLYFTYL